MSLRTASGGLVTVGKLLKAGGEGEVHAVIAPRGMVLKKYKPEILQKAPVTETKVRAMTMNPPAEWRERASGHVTLAWPSQVVMENGRFTGFLMPAVDTATSVELHRIANPTDRRNATGRTVWMRGFTWQYLVRVAANLAQATHVLHTSGSVIGDFNERNVLVTSQALVTLIDCDSMQFTPPGGRAYVCRVGRPEFTPPELLGTNWNMTVREPSSDLFALAIHVYQLLMEGEHPFRGAWSGPGEKPPVYDLAKTGTWAHQRRGQLTPRRSAIDVGLLPGPIREMFRQAFEDGATRPARRPTALDWQRALNALAGTLRQCAANREHFYPPHHRACPWCEHERRRGTTTITVTVPPAPRAAPTRATPAAPTRTVTMPPPAAATGAARGTWQAPAPAPVAAVLTDAGLRPRATRSRLFMLSVGSIFGSSWLFGVGYAAQVAGPASLLAWVIGGAAALVLALVTAELSAMFPVAGGLARFPARAFGGVVGASLGWIAWLQAAAVTALEVIATGRLLQLWVPSTLAARLVKAGAIQPTGTSYGAALALTAVFTALNFCGIGAATRLNSLLTWARLAAIGFAVFALFTHFDKLNLTHAPGGLLPFGPQSVFSAVGGGGIMFAYLGFEQAGHIAGEARNPRRDVAWAIIAPVVIATVIYILLQVSFIGAIPAGGLARGWAGIPASVTDLAQAHAMTSGQLEVLKAAPVVGVLGIALAYSVTAPRLAYGLGRSGLAPAALARTAGGLPWAALVATFAASAVLLLPGATWQQIVADLTSASAFMYAGAPLCLGAFRGQFPGQARPYRLPAASVLAPAAFAVASLVVYWCGWEVYWRVAIALVIGTAALLVTRRPASLNPRAAGWLVAYVVGLGVLARLGQYGGSGTIPLWWDTLVVALFSFAVYAWAMRTRL